MAACWFSVEYCWCSVDMRTYSAARMGPDGTGRDGRLRRSDFIAIAQGPPVGRWQPARLGVLDAIIHSRTKGANLRNLQLRQNGDNLLASPESRLCISNASASTIAPAGLAHLLRVNGIRHMCRSYRTCSPEWRGDKEQEEPLSSRHSGGRTGGRA